MIFTWPIVCVCVVCVGGGGVLCLLKLFGALFFLFRGFFFKFLQGGIIRVLCVIFLQLIGFSLGEKSIKIIDIWSINSHQVESDFWMPTLHIEAGLC